jgi:hypothetical protein
MQFSQVTPEQNPYQVKLKTQAHAHPHSKADRIGIFLSALCVVHCLLTPVVILFLPMMGRYYLAHPLVHYGLALLVFPVGAYAFINGYLAHRRPLVLSVGFLGMLVVSITPIAVHIFAMQFSEAWAMILGGSMLVWAHWQNRRFCKSC